MERVDLVVSFSYPGKKIVTPKVVTMVIRSLTQKADGNPSHALGDFEKMRGFSVATDSNQYDFGNMEMASLSKGEGPSTGSLVLEVLKKDVPLNLFAEIAESNKAQIRVGERKFKLEKEHLEAFRNFVSLTKEQGLEF